MTAFTISSELLILLPPNWVWWYIIISQSLLGNWIAVSQQDQGHSKNFNMSMSVCPDIFRIAEPFTTKLGMVMHHHEPDCHPKRVVCCLHSQGHSEGS